VCHISKWCKPFNTMHKEPVATNINVYDNIQHKNANSGKTASNSTVTMFLLPYFFISSFPLKEKSMAQWWTPHLCACWRSHMQMTHCAAYRTRQYDWQTEPEVSKWLLDRRCAGESEGDLRAQCGQQLGNSYCRHRGTTGFARVDLASRS